MSNHLPLKPPAGSPEMGTMKTNGAFLLKLVCSAMARCPRALCAHHVAGVGVDRVREAKVSENCPQHTLALPSQCLNALKGL